MNKDLPEQYASFDKRPDFDLISPGYSPDQKEECCIHHLFEQQAALTPNNVALVFGDITLTYYELNQAANKLAAFLILRYNVLPDKLIGIMLDRSEKMFIGILAILKVGCAYLPIDPDAPAERNAFICSDAAINIVLTDNPPADNSFFPEIDFINLNNSDVFIGDGENVASKTNAGNLAYVIFTSGSTGKPKGVLIQHGSIINFLTYNINQYRITEKDVMLNISSFFFDASVWELIIPLVTGGRLIILEPGAHKYPEKILRACEQNGITLFFLTPSVLQLFLTYLEPNPAETIKLITLRRLIVGGETLTPKLANLFNKLIYRSLGTGLSNIYGPTETTIWVTNFDCESDTDADIIPIGKPISNTEIYILNPDGNLLPEGEAGELVVGGVQVGRGYLNRPELDKEKFVNNPYRKGEKMYKTGDKARYLPDGNIEFLGRMDNQVKLNGIRIELGEIENTILKNPYIKECVVLLKQISNSNELVVYYTLTNRHIGNKEIKDSLITGLTLAFPDYMVPSFFVELEAFPINSNGKTDRDKLPLPSGRYHQRTINFIAPVSDTEKVITALLTESLNMEEIGIDDNIFDLGVKSLMITKIIIQINSALKTSLTLPFFFKLPTIRQLAYYTDHHHTGSSNPFVLLRQGKGCPLFMLPGAYGNPLTYINFLNNYKLKQPIYSTSYPEDDEFASYGSVQAYAKYLVTQIKLIQPQGPYNFMGYSFGGNIAFEIAFQLQQAGNEIDLLAIVSADASFKKSLFANQNIARDIKFLLKPDAFLLKKYLKYRVPFLYKKFLNKFVSDKIGIIDTRTKANISKMWETYYTPSKFNGDIILIYEEYSKTAYSRYHLMDIYCTYMIPYLWKDITNGKVNAYKLNCLHDDFFSEPTVKNIADIIKNHFQSS